MNKNKETSVKKSTFSNTEGDTRATKSKENKKPVKITLVRNGRIKPPAVRIIKDDLKVRNNASIQTDSVKRQSCTCINALDEPKTNTLNRLVKNIERLGVDDKCRKNHAIAADEKVLKNLNFPYDRAIYKDLIPLVCEKTQYPPSSVRNPLPQKDVEPALADFVEIKRIPDYFILHSSDIEDKVYPVKNNSMRLHKLLNRYD
ncbi:unnamed protein product [Phyllotreta striolata]|uniref:Protein phosphatase 1 regulatory subunit 35 C-terminal domain-containing protein n=1 Tax=Phyllotreta striolata TaxID=444603 RepID=A0A9N9TPK8_PHYSR|nr:unnamed protein product [Phyllotreta striolata]